MSEFAKFVDAFTPAEVANKVKTLGVSKANMPFLPLLVLSMMAGAFISFGAMYYTVAMTHPAEAYGAAKLLGGLAFSLGFILVAIAGGELFTGNNLIVMAWAKKRITLARLEKLELGILWQCAGRFYNRVSSFRLGLLRWRTSWRRCCRT
jgi:formate transporter